MRIIEINQSLLDFLGLEKHAVMGKTGDAIQSNTYGYLGQAYDRDILQGKLYHVIRSGLNQAGKSSYFYGYGSPYFDVSGKIIGVRNIFYYIGSAALSAYINDIDFLNNLYTCKHAHIGQEGLFQHLSVAESEVFFYLIRGWSDLPLAKKLNQPMQRIAELKGLVFFKTGTKDIQQLFDFAVRQNLLCNVPQRLLQSTISQAVPKSLTSQTNQPHYIAYQKSVQSIAKPVLTKGIDYFCYGKYYTDHSVVLLSNLPEWLQAAQQKDMLTSYETLDLMLRERRQSGNKDNSFTYRTRFDYATQHNIPPEFSPSTSFVMVTHTVDHFELFCFGSTDRRFDEKQYAARQVEFMHFKSYFLGQAKNIIASAEQCKIRFKNTPGLADDFNVRRFSLAHGVSLSARELEVLAQVSRAVPCKIIGNKLGVSEKTINEYVRRLRVKFNCHTRYELTKIYWRSAAPGHSLEH